MILIQTSGLCKFINELYFKLINNKSRYLIYYGGAGSGKSVAAAQKQIIRIIQAFYTKKPVRLLCMRKTTPAVRKSAYEEIKSLLYKWSLSQIVTENKTRLQLVFPDSSEILFMGLDDPEKLKSIHGITSVWMEEATEFTLDDFRQIDLRLRGKTNQYKQILMTFNPVNEQHWIKKQFFDDEIQKEIESGKQIVSRHFTANSELTIVHSTYKDNRFIDQAYIERLERLIEEDINYYNIYTLGKWGVLKGRIFENYSTAETVPDKYDIRIYGLDFGYSIDPAAFVECRIIGKTLYVKEHLYQPNLTNKELADLIRSILDANQDKNGLILADSSEPKSIAELKRFGLNCQAAAKGPDSVLFGIQKMKQYQIIIDRESTNILKEFDGYKWAEDKFGNQLNKPVQFNDHAIDAIRYAVSRINKEPIKFISEDKYDVSKTNYNEEDMWNEF